MKITLRQNVHEQVELFCKTLLNIFHIFVPNKVIVCNDKGPPWMNDEIKKMIKRKNWVFKSQRKSFDLEFAILHSLTQDISGATASSKLKCHERLANKLNDPKKAPKTFVNSTKILKIPPLLVGNQLVSDFLVKTNLINDNFSKQCTTIDNNSPIPTNISFEAEKSLSTFEIRSGDIVKIIRSLDPNKAHGDDEISISMIETCASSISKPPAILFRNCFESECFPKE